MPSARNDYLLRMMQQIAAMARRLHERLAGGASAHEVLREAGSTIGTLLGPQHVLLDRLDPTSAVQLVGNSDTVRAWIDLLRVQGEADVVAGDTAAAATFTARADALASALRRTTADAPR